MVLFSFQVLGEVTRHTTRFIGLGKVGNPEKKKWIYAFNVVPIKTIDKRELVALAPDVTDMPYTQGDLNAAVAKVEKSSQFFYDMNAPMDDKNKRGKKRNHEQNKDQFQQKKQRQPAGPCWFCKSFPKFLPFYETFSSLKTPYEDTVFLNLLLLILILIYLGLFKH